MEVQSIRKEAPKPSWMGRRPGDRQGAQACGLTHAFRRDMEQSTPHSRSLFLWITEELHLNYLPSSPKGAFCYSSEHSIHRWGRNL